MARTNWPDDHPNTKFQMFVDSSRQVISRVPPAPFVEGTAAMLDRIEALIDQQYVARTRAEIEWLVAQVVPLVNEAVARMNVITAQLQQIQAAKPRELAVTRFDATWDRQLRLTTWLAGLILVSVAAVMLAMGLAQGEIWPFFLVACILAAVLAGAWLLAPTGFELRARELIVLRRILRVRIRLEDIRAVDRLADRDLVGAIRLGGNGGLFGWYGRFWNRRLGLFRLYATRRAGLVRVDTERELFVLSPAGPDAFVEAVLQRAHRAHRGAEPAAGRRRRVGIQVLRGVATVAVILVLIVGAILVALRGLSPVAVRVDEDAVVVERRWRDPVEIPLRTVQGSHPLPSQQARRWWRTTGTDLGEVRYGRWASRQLGEFRLYAWRHGPYVLLETSEGRVILTPDDPEEFVEAVRRRIGER